VHPHVAHAHHMSTFGPIDPYMMPSPYLAPYPYAMPPPAQFASAPYALNAGDYTTRSPKSAEMFEYKLQQAGERGGPDRGSYGHRRGASVDSPGAMGQQAQRQGKQPKQPIVQRTEPTTTATASAPGHILELPKGKAEETDAAIAELKAMGGTVKVLEDGSTLAIFRSADKAKAAMVKVKAPLRLWVPAIAPAELHAAPPASPSSSATEFHASAAPPSSVGHT